MKRLYLTACRSKTYIANANLKGKNGNGFIPFRFSLWWPVIMKMIRYIQMRIYSWTTKTKQTLGWGCHSGFWLMWHRPTDHLHLLRRSSSILGRFDVTNPKWTRMKNICDAAVNASPRSQTTQHVMIGDALGVARRTSTKTDASGEPLVHLRSGNTHRMIHNYPSAKSQDTLLLALVAVSFVFATKQGISLYDIYIYVHIHMYPHAQQYLSLESINNIAITRRTIPQRGGVLSLRYGEATKILL